MPSDAAFGLGHNLPSVTDLLRDRYGAKITAVEEIAARASAMKRTVDSDDDLPAVAEIVKAARELRHDVDGLRSTENKPHLAAQRDTNAFFNVMIERLQKIQQFFEGETNAYQNRKAQEERARQAEIARREREEAERKLAVAAASRSQVEGEVILNEALRADARAEEAEQRQSASVAELTRTRTEHGTVSSSAVWSHNVDDWSLLDLNELRDQFTVPEIEKAIRSHVRRFRNTRPLKGVRIFETAKSTFR